MESPFPEELTARFRPIRPLGQGGYGAVWLATQVGLERDVALKLLASDQLTDEHEVVRFEAEARVTCGLRHPGIVGVIDSGVVDGQPWIAYQLVEGRTLSELIDERPLDPALAAGLIAQAARALQAAHDNGVIHRDIKPQNLLVAADGTLRVADFGIALYASSSRIRTATGILLGSPSYLAPELIRGGNASPASDIYALGATLYHALTGFPPFVDETLAAVLQAHLETPPPRASDLSPRVPASLDDVVLVALAKQPAARFQSGEALAVALDRASGSAARTPARPPRATRGDTRVLSELAPELSPGEPSAPADPSPRTRRTTRREQVLARPRRRSRVAPFMALALALGVGTALIAVRAHRGVPHPAPVSPVPSSRPASLAPIELVPAGPVARRLILAPGHRDLLVHVELDRPAPLRVIIRGAGGPREHRSGKARLHHVALHALTPNSPYLVDLEVGGGATVRDLPVRTDLGDVDGTLTPIEQIAGTARLAGFSMMGSDYPYLPDEAGIGAQLVGAMREDRVGSANALSLADRWQSRAMLDQFIAAQVVTDRENQLLLARLAARFGHPAATRVLASALPADAKLASPSAKRAILETLAELPPPGGGFSVLAAQVERLEPEASEHIAELLVSLDRQEARRRFRTWVATRSPESAQRGVLGLLGLGVLAEDEDVELLAQVLSAPRWKRDATVAAHALGRAGTAGARVAVRRALANAPTADAIWATVRQQDTAAIPELAALLAPAGATSLRAAAACALGALGATDHERALVRLLDESHPSVSRAAAWALGRLKRPESRAALATFAASERDLDGVGAWALMEVAGPAGWPVLEQRLRTYMLRLGDGEPDVIGPILIIGALHAPEASRIYGKFLDTSKRMRAYLATMKRLGSTPDPNTRVAFPFVLYDPVGLAVRRGDVVQHGLTATWDTASAVAEGPQAARAAGILVPSYARSSHRLAHTIADSGSHLIFTTAVSDPFIPASEIDTDGLHGLAIRHLRVFRAAYDFAAPGDAPRGTPDAPRAVESSPRALSR